MDTVLVFCALVALVPVQAAPADVRASDLVERLKELLHQRREQQQSPAREATEVQRQQSKVRLFYSAPES